MEDRHWNFIHFILRILIIFAIEFLYDLDKLVYEAWDRKLGACTRLRRCPHRLHQITVLRQYLDNLGQLLRAFGFDDKARLAVLDDLRQSAARGTNHRAAKPAGFK